MTTDLIPSFAVVDMSGSTLRIVGTAVDLGSSNGFRGTLALTTLTPRRGFTGSFAPDASKFCDFVIEQSADGSTGWRPLVTVPRFTDIGTAPISFGGADRYVRVVRSACASEAVATLTGTVLP